MIKVRRALGQALSAKSASCDERRAASIRAVDPRQFVKTSRAYATDRCQRRRPFDMEDPDKLRQLASWYREFAERTENLKISVCRLRTAEDLDEEADRIERLFAASHDAT